MDGWMTDGWMGERVGLWVGGCLGWWLGGWVGGSVVGTHGWMTIH